VVNLHSAGGHIKTNRRSGGIRQGNRRELQRNASNHARGLVKWGDCSAGPVYILAEQGRPSGTGRSSNLARMSAADSASNRRRGTTGPQQRHAIMELITLIPAVLCIRAIYRSGTAYAFQYVFLPVLLLMPTYFLWNFRPLPSINFLEAAVIPLGVGMIFQDISRWKFSRTDIYVLAWLMSGSYADYQLGRTTDAIFSLFSNIAAGLFPYMAGKLLIEQTGSRIKVCKIFVWLLSISFFLSSYEFFFRVNPYNFIWAHFYHGQWTVWITQIRWGFGRVAGPYSQSELAGMMVFTGLLMVLWLGRSNYQERQARTPPPPLMRRGKVHIWILLAYLYITQARGPWIGGIFGMVVAGIGLAKFPVRRAIIVVSCFVLIGMPLYIFGKDYLSGPRKDYGSEKETAQYRAELFTNYIPVAQQGGAWGWGVKFPIIDGQNSIDNEYLFSWVVQGYVGAVSLILLMLDTIITLIIHSAKAHTVRERHFTLTLLGLIVGIAFTISTVFLGDQSYDLLFLLFGWSQAIQETPMGLNDMRRGELPEKKSEAYAIRVYS
jgi:hypothetical protein